MPQHQFLVIGDKDEFDPEKWASSSQEGLPRRHPETHVDVLIVGAGYTGLMTALECWRKGHNVVGILERSKGPNYSGSCLKSKGLKRTILWRDFLMIFVQETSSSSNHRP